MMIQEVKILPSSMKLREKLNQLDSDMIRILFLERQNLEQSSLVHLNRSWKNLSNLSLGYNQICMLTQLRDSTFPNLCQLYLNNNNIESIQPLTLVQFGKLKKLSLKNNKISSISPIRKLNIPQLAHLSLYGNKINQYKGFSQFETELTSLELQYTNNRPMGQNLSWVFKINFVKLEKLTSLSSARVSQNKLVELLKQKFIRLSRQN